jgi:TRAP-type C4-dicarboxylate transport system substrate-binding protein
MMKISRRRTSALLLLGLVAFAATTADAADWVLNVNTALSEDDPIYAGLERFKVAVDEKSGGRLEIRIFPGSQLGSDEDMLEQARAGAMWRCWSMAPGSHPMPASSAFWERPT